MVSRSGRLGPAQGRIRSRWQRSLPGRYPVLGALTGATVLAETADQFCQVAMIWVVLVISRSPADAGLVVLCQRTPEILTGPWLGARFDRWPAIPLTVAGFLIRGGAAAVIAIAAVAGSLSVALVLTLCLIMGLANPLAKVGTRVVLPAVVPKGDLQVANGILTIGDQFPYLVGPALGGALVGIAGAPSLFAPAAMCLLAALGVARVKLGPRTPDPAAAGPPDPAGAGRAIWAGFRPMVSVPVVRAMMMLTVIYYISYGPLLPAMPLYARDQLHASGAGYGAMWSALGVGALAGLVLIPRLTRLRPAMVNSASVALWGVVLLPLVIVHSLPLALIMMFLGGVVWAPYAATEVSVIQHWVSARQYGAVFGARRSVIVASSPSGSALGGVLLERLSPAAMIGWSSAACILGGTVFMALPSVRRTRPLPGPATGPPADRPPASDLTLSPWPAAVAGEKE